MMYSTSADEQGPSNVYTMMTEIGTVQTLDESPPSFTLLQIRDPTDANDRIVVTFQLNEAGTAYCRVTRSDSGETTLRINQILSANYGTEVATFGDVGYITIDKLEERDPPHKTLHEASQYNVFCWAKDSAVDSGGYPRPNYMHQAYLEQSVGSSFADTSSPSGGFTSYVWVKDMTPPTIIYISSEAISDSVIQITLQLNEPGTVWCHPVEPIANVASIDVDDVTPATYISMIKGRHSSFMENVHVPFVNVDVEVDRLDNDDGFGSTSLASESPYKIFCFAEDDWWVEATSAPHTSPNFDSANVNTSNMTSGNGNEVGFDVVEDIMHTVGTVTTLDLTPPVITIVNITSAETSITVTVKLDETGTVWCQAVRKGFDAPTILEILDTNFYSLYPDSLSTVGATTTVELIGYNRPRNFDNSYLTPLVLGTDYDVYCYADDDLCVGCRVTNGVSFAHVLSTKATIRTKDYTLPNMRYVTAESIARDQVLVTLQVDEGSRVWCAVWSSDPSAGWSSAAAEAAIKGKEGDCHDGRGRRCGTFWIYDLDDIEDDISDGVYDLTTYEDAIWKFNQDVDIIVSGLTERTDYPYIYCYAEDDETPPNKMIFDNAASAGPSNIHTMQMEIGTIQTLDESPPSFTHLSILDPSAHNDRLVVTFKLNEAGTAYCRAKYSDSAETTLRINQILTANYFDNVADSSALGQIVIDKLEFNDDRTLYEAARYDVYCWAKDSAVDTNGYARPNYMVQSYVETAVGNVNLPQGGKTTNVWIRDTTPPTIIVVAREALAEDTIQVTLQLNEPGTIWCQIVNKDSLAPGHYCQDQDVLSSLSPGDPCHYETFVKGVPAHGTTFSAEVHVPYQDHDINLNKIEKVTPVTAGESLTAQEYYNVWCFAEDDWALQATLAPNPSPSFTPPVQSNKILWPHAKAVKDSIGLVLTLDQTAPSWLAISGTPYSETQLQMDMTLDEQGTIWCMAVRHGFAEPSVNEILQNNEYSTDCGTPCDVMMQGLQSKTTYDVWCYAEDDNVYPQRPNGRKFMSGAGGQVMTLTTLDETPPILTIVSAESPVSSEIRIKVKMDEPGEVWCNSWVSGSSGVDFTAVISGGYKAYVGNPAQSPNSPINTNVEVVVGGLQEQTQYDTFCAAQDGNLPSHNKLTSATILSTKPAIGGIITLDQTPPTFTKLTARGTDENTIRVTFKCNEACRAYCRVTRSDSGETSLSINRILKANFWEDQAGTVGSDQTIDLNRLEDDSSLPLIERGTLYDTYCWIRDEALQHSCYAKGAGAECTTFPRPNYQSQVYVDTMHSGTNGGKILHVRTPDTTPPTVIFVEAESTEDTSITVTLQLDEPGTAFCRAYTSTQTADATLVADLITGATSNPVGTIYQNTVTNWNNIYKNFEVKVTDLMWETKYYVYCIAEDDELMEGSTMDPPAAQNNQAAPVLTEASGRFTLDLTPPSVLMVSIRSESESTATVVVQLDEPGTIWCKAVRDRFEVPTINQVIASGFFTETAAATVDFEVKVENLERDTEYDVYCHARDRGTEVEYGVTPLAGNPGNDATAAALLTTKRDIHTMGDSTSPTITSVSPVHQSTGVGLNPIFEITFNEDIQAGSGYVTFQAEGGSPTIGLNISQANNGLCASSTARLSITLTTFRADFGPCPSFLSANTRWNVDIAAGVFNDDSVAANPVPAFGQGGYYFTTTP
eukprot:TRINITY_DN11111_c1_g1_i1.p1 TRINITY_DN11111_c1_g1~~TRINITY_DN11111_c1_g1_i1.p1  ORF type:complete len:1928 (+),score=277.30 TRINITY_DN11111_c1_g1_i1:722-5785(+)